MGGYQHLALHLSWHSQDGPTPKTVAKQLEEAAIAALPANDRVQKSSFRAGGSAGLEGIERPEDLNQIPWDILVELSHQDQPIGLFWCCHRCDLKGEADLFYIQAILSAADHLSKFSCFPDPPKASEALLTSAEAIRSRQPTEHAFL